MKYLLNAVAGQIKGLIEIEDTDATPSGFITLTKEEYDIAIAKVQKDRFLRWDESNRTFSTNTTQVNQADTAALKSEQLTTLKQLSIDIDFYTRMANTTKVNDLQSEFDALKVLYES